jgi:hypothetical protein
MKIYNIKLNPTQRTLFICVGEWDKKQADDYFKCNINIDSEYQGAYVTAEIDNYFEPVLWVKKRNSKATFIHECVHCVTDIMEITGIKDDEFRAWYTEWLYNTIIDAIRLSK